MGKDKSMENDRIQIENESMKKELKDKLSDILNLDEENGRLKQQLLSYDDLTSQMKDKSMENDRLQIENESMKKELKDKLSDILNLDEENGRLKRQLLSIENLTNQMKDMSMENDRLQQQILAY